MAEIKRKDAASLIDRLMQEVAEVIEAPGQPPPEWALNFKYIFEHSGLGLKIPTKCTGQAHQPGVDQDHCGVCMPRWGWCSTPTKVK